MTEVRSNYPKKRRQKKAKSSASCSCIVRDNWVMKDVYSGKMKGKRDSRRAEQVNRR